MSTTDTMTATDTIAAIATGSEASAIGIIRISGNLAISAAGRIFRTNSGTPAADMQDKRMYCGKLLDVNGGLIDHCICMLSRSPGSYTGEDTAELHCHGSPVILSQALQSLFAQGVRQAQAGEFTKRAFLNGKMDLTQAEAVIDLIEAETSFAAKNAAGQLGGAICKKIDAVYDALIDMMAHFHAVIDYPDEDIGEFDAKQYADVLNESEQQLNRLLETHERGKVLIKGIPTVIAGRTNTGKSSLLNALLGYGRAIVTDIHGTTRDTIEERILVKNVLLRLIDTAGIRKTNDEAEKIGISRTKEALERAGLVIHVLDGSQPLQPDDCEVCKSIPAGIPVIKVINKSDLPQVAEGLCQHGNCSQFSRNVRLSSITGEGISNLEDGIQKIFPGYGTAPAGEIITSTRQAEAISRAVQSIGYAKKALLESVSPDAVLTDIESAISSIGEVTGKTMREDIITRIFSRFCVGK